MKFVGNANQGKTSLLHKLKKKKPLMERPTVTDGVEINRSKEKNKNGKEKTFSTWIFAGQEVN